MSEILEVKYKWFAEIVITGMIDTKKSVFGKLVILIQKEEAIRLRNLLDSFIKADEK